MKITKRIELDPSDSRAVVFTSYDTEGKLSTYRLKIIDILADGDVWGWAEQMTKKGQPYKSGMGLTVSTGTGWVARILEEEVAAFRSIDAAHGEALAIHNGHGQVLKELHQSIRVHDAIQPERVTRTLSNGAQVSMPAERGEWLDELAESMERTISQRIHQRGADGHLVNGVVSSARHLVQTAAGLSAGSAQVLSEAIGIMERNPNLARTLAGIILTDQHAPQCTAVHRAGMSPCTR